MGRPPAFLLSWLINRQKEAGKYLRNVLRSNRHMARRNYARLWVATAACLTAAPAPRRTSMSSRNLTNNRAQSASLGDGSIYLFLPRQQIFQDFLPSRFFSFGGGTHLRLVMP